jgi:hypothetical protein
MTIRDLDGSYDSRAPHFISEGVQSTSEIR